MNNLGVCRAVIAKQVHGQDYVKTIMIAVMGYAVGKACEIGVKLIKDKLRPLKQNSLPKKTFNVNGIYSSEDGFELTFGDKFKVLELGDKYATIRKEGGFNNAHRIPVEALNSLIENQ